MCKNRTSVCTRRERVSEEGREAVRSVHSRGGTAQPGRAQRVGTSGRAHSPQQAEGLSRREVGPEKATAQSHLSGSGLLEQDSCSKGG